MLYSGFLLFYWLRLGYAGYFGHYAFYIRLYCRGWRLGMLFALLRWCLLVHSGLRFEGRRVSGRLAGCFGGEFSYISSRLRILGED